MRDFEALLEAIAKRPAMYVGKSSLRSIADFMHGYDHALSDIGQTVPPLAGWMRWVELHFRISHPAWHWSRILLHVYGSDRAAIEALPQLYQRFLEQRAALGIENIEAKLGRLFIAEYGLSCHEPSETTTSIDF